MIHSHWMEFDDAIDIIEKTAHVTKNCTYIVKCYSFSLYIILRSRLV